MKAKCIVDEKKPNATLCGLDPQRNVFTVGYLSLNVVHMDELCPTCLWTLERGEEYAKKPSVDPVNHPSHYNTGKIEVLEFIEDQQLGFHRGNVVKYVARAGKKTIDQGELQDLEKALFYLRREVELVRAKLEKREPCRPNEMK